MPSLSSRLTCLRCNQALPEEDWNAPEMRRCPACDALFRTLAFPALLREARPVQPAPLGMEGDATCFYHSRKKAVTPCDNCGRFLCALCEIEFRGERWCPACLGTGRRKRTRICTSKPATSITTRSLWPWRRFPRSSVLALALRRAHGNLRRRPLLAGPGRHPCPGRGSATIWPSAWRRFRRSPGSGSSLF